MNDILTHHCRRCQREQAAAEFYSNPRTASGLMSWCKACCRDYQQQYRERQPAATTKRPPLVTEPTFSGFYLGLRPREVFSVHGLPWDLTRSEADRLERIILAFADPEPVRNPS